MNIPTSVALGTEDDPLLSAAQRDAVRRYPRSSSTMRCEGPAFFRTPAARDLGYLLDTDPRVQRWHCLPLVLRHHEAHHIPDFLVIRSDGALLVDAASSETPSPTWRSEASRHLGLRYERFAIDSGLHWRLENARELLAYASYPVTMQERLLLLSCLDEHGSLPLVACLHILRRSRDPIASIAALILRNVVSADLDSGLLDPGTRIRRTEPSITASAGFRSLQ